MYKPHPYKYEDSEHCQSTRNTEAEAGETNCRRHIEELVQEYGGEMVLRNLGQYLQRISDSDTAQIVGRVIKDLAQMEW